MTSDRRAASDAVTMISERVRERVHDERIDVSRDPDAVSRLGVA